MSNMDDALKQAILKDSMYWDTVINRIERSLQKESDDEQT